MYFALEENVLLQSSTRGFVFAYPNVIPKNRNIPVTKITFRK